MQTIQIMEEEKFAYPPLKLQAEAMKASNAAGELDGRAMNNLLIDFMISIVDVDGDIRHLQERVLT